jgi:hypothetical protein
MTRARRISPKKKGGKSVRPGEVSQPERDAVNAHQSIEEATRLFLVEDERLAEASRRQLEAIKKDYRARGERAQKGTAGN